MDQRLTGRIAVITGGSAGIGGAASRLFAKHGCTVSIWSTNRTTGQAAVDEINASGGKAEYRQVNVADYAAVEAAANAVAEALGGIDILVNNAGITRDTTLAKMTPQMWQEVIDVNLTGVFNCTKAITPHILARVAATSKHGRIINTSSVVAHDGNFGQTNYVATKAGVIGMTKTWARELGRKGITVNAVAPGFITTDMLAHVPDKVLDGIKERTPLQRLGTPEDIANAYLWLASEESAFITGAILRVDGGLTL